MELGALPEFYMPNQYENEANLEAHVRTTGPEIWRQTEGKITHFVAGLGTCGTITGNCRYLKSKNPGVQVIGVHPAEGHDIPGVRSLKQLELTKLFVPDEYDALIEVGDAEAFDMCLRLNREESMIAGPSSAMALVGALKVIEDQPDAVVVIIFPDNSFKYASTFERHFPEMRASRPGDGDASGEPSAKEQLFGRLVENSRNAHNTCEVDDLRAGLESDTPPFVIDVRMEELYAGKHISGAVNIPTEELDGREGELPEDRAHPIVTVCTRGNLSLQGMLVLQSLGYRNVRSMNGGTVAWAEQGLPTEE
jgi:rhodanese-related sulfurtransferase